MDACSSTARPRRSKTTPRCRQSTWAAASAEARMDSSLFDRAHGSREGNPILSIDRLNAYYGHAHALQSVTLTFAHGVLAVVGRNGMGKTTLCNAITGLIPATGSVKLSGREICGLPPHEI